MIWNLESVARAIDHALLGPELGDPALEEGCLRARESGVASVCIKPFAVPRCVDLLRGSPVLPSTVVGFPHGGHSSAVKVVETEEALAAGAVEIDMVVNVGKVLSRDWGYVEKEIRAVTELCHGRRGLVKVIFETCYLTREHKVELCRICTALGVDFVKTSTGFGPAGATVEDVRLLRESCPPAVRVKASGGIRTLDHCLAMMEAGADRVGASRTFEILAECRARA